MGGGKGGGKSQTVGYKYHIGMHLIACHGPADCLLRLTVDERLAWEGVATGGQITVNKPKLFGGDEREGGVSGKIDVEMGGPAQTKNDYLLARIGSNIPAYRGVVGLVFRQTYMGNNPYLKPWRMRLRRIHLREDGLEQWYDEKAAIPGGVIAGAAPVLLRWQQSSWHPADNDHARMGFRFLNALGVEISNSFAAMTGTPDHVWTEREHAAVAPVGTATIRVVMEMQRNEGVNNDGYIDGIELFVNGVATPLVNPGGESVLAPAGGQHVGPAYTPGWTNTVGQIGIRSDDPAPYAGQRFFMGGVGASASAYQDVVTGDHVDMNPSHIIRESLTNPDWGMGYNEDDVDDDFFEAAADTLFAERLGISLLWDRQMALESFIAEVIKHIDAALYVSRSTGKFRLRLTRFDYDPETLLVLDESNIDKIENPHRPSFGELVNSVSVKFWNNVTGKDDSVTVQDPAGVQMQGAVINTTVQYPGFTRLEVGSRIAGRDLRALSNPFLTCTVYTSEAQAADLDIGDCFKLTWGKWHLSETIMRVTGFAMSDGKTSQIRINCVEDVFSTPVQAVIVPPSEEWVDPAGAPALAAADTAFEIPYYEIIQRLGQTTTDAELALDPDRGFIGAAAMRGNAASISAHLWTDSGAGYEDVGNMDLCPGGFLTADLTKTATAFTLEDHEDLDLVVVGTHAQIGEGDDMELVRVDSVDDETGAVTVGRGVLDTVPHEHPAGTAILFWDNYGGFDPTEYVAAEVIAVKVQPVSGSDEVALADVPERNVELATRAFRPYPPGDLRINGESYTTEGFDGELTISWTHRDRVQQTSGELFDHTFGDVGPEAGQVYRLRGYIDGVLAHTEDDIAGTSTTWTPDEDGLVRVAMSSKRDGVYSMQEAEHEFYYSASGVKVTEAGEPRVYEDGSLKITED